MAVTPLSFLLPPTSPPSPSQHQFSRTSANNVLLRRGCPWVRSLSLFPLPLPSLSSRSGTHPYRPPPPARLRCPDGPRFRASLALVPAPTASWPRRQQPPHPRRPSPATPSLPRSAVVQAVVPCDPRLPHPLDAAPPREQRPPWPPPPVRPAPLRSRSRTNVRKSAQPWPWAAKVLGGRGRERGRREKGGERCDCHMGPTYQFT